MLLLMPLVAMQFSGDERWNLYDFVIAAILLAVSGFAGALSTSSLGKRRVVIGLAMLVVIVLVWAELAVGLFGTPFAGS
jgi:hypothetical protein